MTIGLGGVFRHAQFEQLAPVPTSLVARHLGHYSRLQRRAGVGRADVLRDLFRTGRELRAELLRQSPGGAIVSLGRQACPGVGVEFALAHALSLGVHDGEVVLGHGLTELGQLTVVLECPLVVGLLIRELRREQVRPRRAAQQNRNQHQQGTHGSLDCASIAQAIDRRDRGIAPSRQSP